MCQHTPNMTEYQRKTHLKTQTPPKCHESGQAPRAETYRAAVQESRGERDSDAPLFTARSLEELSRGLGAVEKELNK